MVGSGLFDDEVVIIRGEEGAGGITLRQERPGLRPTAGYPARWWP